MEGDQMSDRFLSRRKFLGVGAAGTLGVLMTPQAVFADDEEVELLRWDFVTIIQNVLLSAGQDMARDPASGDVVTLTGSGQAAPKMETATGGGTFLHRHADGSEVAHGVYHVTGFQSFVAAGGTLLGTGRIDGIGTLKETTGGVLILQVALMPAGGGSLAGVLGVNCHLPGSEMPIEEGMTLSVGPFAFKQAGGATLFHVLHGELRD
jgi:hypothetical protein